MQTLSDTQKEQDSLGSYFMLEKRLIFFTFINIKSQQMTGRKERENLKEKRSFILL